jgi:hypothetical protein
MGFELAAEMIDTTVARLLGAAGDEGGPTAEQLAVGRARTSGRARTPDFRGSCLQYGSYLVGGGGKAPRPSV